MTKDALATVTDNLSIAARIVLNAPLGQSLTPSALRSIASYAFPLTSFSRWESVGFWADADPCPSAGSGRALRGGNDDDEFHLFGWPEGPYPPRMAILQVYRIRPTGPNRSLLRSSLFPGYFGARD
jgi:hypothetical protein